MADPYRNIVQSQREQVEAYHHKDNRRQIISWIIAAILAILCSVDVEAKEFYAVAELVPEAEYVGCRYVEDKEAIFPFYINNETLEHLNTISQHLECFLIPNPWYGQREGDLYPNLVQCQEDQRSVEVECKEDKTLWIELRNNPMEG